jgi:hypothetical protein
MTLARRVVRQLESVLKRGGRLGSPFGRNSQSSVYAIFGGST